MSSLIERMSALIGVIRSSLRTVEGGANGFSFKVAPGRYFVNAAEPTTTSTLAGVANRAASSSPNKSS